MIGYHFTLTCRWCASPLVHLADARPTGFDSRAVAKCSGCNTEWAVVVNIIPSTDRGRAAFTPAKRASTQKAREAKLAVTA